MALDLMYNVTDLTNVPKNVDFNPYADNGGTVVAIAGADFSVIASDTRLSAGYSIYTREQPKIFQMGSRTILGCTGCWCDTLTLTRQIKTRLQIYEYDHNREMSTPAVSQLLTQTLYSRRFFPYYVSNVLAGLDTEGRGCVYSYDPIGHCERSACKAGGSSGTLLQPLFDNQISLHNLSEASDDMRNLTVERAVTIIKDGFISASERDIYTGDAITIKIITKDGIRDDYLLLRKD